MEPLLEVKDLRTYFYTDEGEIKAVDGVSLSIPRGRTLAVVGESGSGKSIMASSIMRIIPQPPGKIVSGSITLNGEDLLSKTEEQMQEIRGNRISMIFQEPMTSLNPVLRVGYQIGEAIRLHQNASREEARERTVELLRHVGVPDPDRRVNDYPHQLSGGMRQRVMIAMALACRPELLIADEPTTALDVTVQAQILDLMKKLQDELGTAILLITHDFGIVAEMADQVAVMYCGQVVEFSDVETIFESPVHPYTRGLLQSIPRLDVKQEKLFVIEGTVPHAARFPSGCRFAPRCPVAGERCLKEMPVLRNLGNGHQVRCHKAGGVSDAG
ncbi:MAG TPA: ABC transporter ATP-binding protein [Syntrophomonadaceae bacterium]|nr:ABC transporter ATP-binding protein [Syntrophomonadaceae bacterium]